MNTAPRCLGIFMADLEKKSRAALEAELAELKKNDSLAQRQVALMTAIIRIFRESSSCQTEEEVAQVCLKAAEELTGSTYGFIGEINAQGRFDTTTLSEAGWNACRVPRPEAAQLLKNMPARGINRIGLVDHKPWIINDVLHHPGTVEKPQGHPPAHLVHGGSDPIRRRDRRHDRLGEQGARVYRV